MMPRNTQILPQSQEISILFMIEEVKSKVFDPEKNSVFAGGTFV